MSVRHRADDDQAVARAAVLAVMCAVVTFLLASSHYIC
jgi:hypothetical protein